MSISNKPGAHLTMHRIMNAGRSMLELVLLMAVGLVPVFSGLLVMIYQVEVKLAENAAISVQEAVFSVDQALDRVHEVAARALPLAGQTCEQVKEALLDQVASRSMLRSLTLVSDGQAYCSTTSDPLSVLSTLASPGRLVTLSSTLQDRNDHLLVNLYLPQGRHGVVATVYTTQLRTELSAFQDGLTLMLDFNEHYLWSNGDSLSGMRPSLSEFNRQADSAQYEYRVVGGYAAGYTAREIRESMLNILPSLMLVGLMTGAVVYFALGRVRSRTLEAPEGQH